MAAEKMEEERKVSSFSFKVSKSKSHAASVDKNKKFMSREEDEEDIDYILSAEGLELKSQKPKKDKKKLVIPLIQRNTGGKFDSKDQEAANELLKDLQNQSEVDSKEDIAIPLLLRNKLPINDVEVDGKLNVQLMPSVSNADDYESVPVTAFGAAMLRGMGWKEGQTIGLTNKGLTQPIEFIPRHKGLGLGAEKKQEEKKQRRRKLGEPKETTKNGPIIEKNGKVRHFKGVGESVYKHPQGFAPGAFCLIERGPHQGVYGKIVAVDEDNARATIKLVLGQQQITLSQYHLTLVDEEEYRTNSSGKRKTLPHEERQETKRKKNDEDSDKPDKRTKQKEEQLPSWLFPNIRVRMVSRSFKKGRLYYKKLEVVDVISREHCVCKTDEGRLIEDVRQVDLETVIPKKTNSLVMVVDGKYKGQIGKLLERHPEQCKAHIQLLSNKHVTKLDYDFMCEYLGRIGDDDFL